jgi:Type IV secretion-system coupling protein DNA-binding domain
VLRSGGIIIVHTAAGIVGADTSALVGATILGLVQVALGSQAQLPEDERWRTQVVIDEFQAIPGADYAGMLSELRKFGGVFVLATQSLAHLDKLGQALHATVLSNVGNLFAFGMSAEDARRIAPELDGTVTAQDLINLEDFTCYARLTQNGQRLRTFSLAVDPPPSGAPEQEREIRRRSRELLCRPRAEVEDELQRVMQFQLSPGWLPGGYPPVPGEYGTTLPEEEPDEWRNAPEPQIAMDVPATPDRTRGQTIQPSAKRPRTRRRSTAAERQMGGGRTVEGN